MAVMVDVVGLSQVTIIVLSQTLSCVSAWCDSLAMVPPAVTCFVGALCLYVVLGSQRKHLRGINYTAILTIVAYRLIMQVKKSVPPF